MTPPFPLVGVGAPRGNDPAVKPHSDLRKRVLDIGSEVILVDTSLPAEIAGAAADQDTQRYIMTKLCSTGGQIN